ncbi:MAG: pyridoxamine 5'-phosphate oxidase [Geminicoccaceae bacterium]|nr:MAG: pyridoxamine 5'-phosphate oxidase [Geminicoccaceae bacterium]
MADPAGLRRDYQLGALSEEAIGDDPFRLFDDWWQDALHGGLVEPNAMTLATVDAAGRPSARVVLLKAYDHHGFVWYTNYDSRKAHDLAANPHAALLFWFDKLERQVRVEGTVEKVSPAVADAYFHSRPRGSQIGAWASPQSQPIADRAALDALQAATEARFGDGPIPRPPHWGGFRLEPVAMEFWQGGRSRLHDRFRFARESEGWRRQRLAP